MEENLQSLVNASLVSFVAREFWLEGNLVNPYCLLFMGDDQGRAWEFFLNDEDYTWKLKRTGSVPPTSHVEGDSTFRYLHRDLFPEYPIQKIPIMKFVEFDRGDAAIAQLEFKNDRTFVFSYFYASEKISLILETVP